MCTDGLASGESRFTREIVPIDLESVQGLLIGGLSTCVHHLI